VTLADTYNNPAANVCEDVRDRIELCAEQKQLVMHLSLTTLRPHLDKNPLDSILFHAGNV
jgi:hypothetical protein